MSDVMTIPPTLPAELLTETDTLRRFLLTQAGWRGVWVQLETSWQDARRYRDYPHAVREQLGCAMAAAVLLSATIKFHGSLILQTQGDGLLSALSAQATHRHEVRGWARFQTSPELEQPTAPQRLWGHGYLVMTVDPQHGESYQGIVQMDHNGLAAALRHYFDQSEQLPTRLWLFADAQRAAGLLLQAMPERSARDDVLIEQLANTVTATEMLQLPCESLLYRLFAQETPVRVFDAEAVCFRCGCSHDKTQHVLRSLGRAALLELLDKHPVITVDCQFCGRQYAFDRVDVEQLLQHPDTPSAYSSTTSH